MPPPRGKGRFSKDRKPKRNTQSLLFRRKRFCRFTVTGVKEIDYKDIDTLREAPSWLTSDSCFRLRSSAGRPAGVNRRAPRSTIAADSASRFVRPQPLAAARAAIPRGRRSSS